MTDDELRARAQALADCALTHAETLMLLVLPPVDLQALSEQLPFVLLKAHASDLDSLLQILRDAETPEQDLDPITVPPFPPAVCEDCEAVYADIPECGACECGCRAWRFQR